MIHAGPIRVLGNEKNRVGVHVLLGFAGCRVMGAPNCWRPSCPMKKPTRNKQSPETPQESEAVVR